MSRQVKVAAGCCLAAIVAGTVACGSDKSFVSVKPAEGGSGISATSAVPQKSTGGDDPAAVKGFCDGYYYAHSDLQTAIVELPGHKSSFDEVSKQSHRLADLLDTYEHQIKHPSFRAVLPAERAMLKQVDAAVATQDTLALLKAMQAEPADVASQLTAGVCKGQQYW